MMRILNIRRDVQLYYEFTFTKGDEELIGKIRFDEWQECHDHSKPMYRLDCNNYENMGIWFCNKYDVIDKEDRTFIIEEATKTGASETARYIGLIEGRKQGIKELLTR